MIIDARRANRLFRRTPKTALGSADSLSQLTVDDDNSFVLAQEDVKECFCRLGTPRDIGE